MLQSPTRISMNPAVYSTVMPQSITDLLACLFTYFLTPLSRVLSEKFTGSELVKKLPEFYGTRRFLKAFTSSRHLSLS